MSNWTSDRVLALAPDASSASAGRGLASFSKWVSFARNDAAIWGECQGSGKLPYQTRVDLEGGSAKCSCPSRKFPCKHSIGLLLLYAAKPDSFATADPPPWVAEWLETRAQKAETKAAKAAEPPKPADEAAQTKRLAARAKKVEKGLEELQLWLYDLVRGGLAQAPGKGYGYWDAAAKRLVDAQAPGLARMVRELAEHTSGEGWQERLLQRLGRIHLLVQGHKHLEGLSPETQADLRTAIGFSQPQEEVLAQEGVLDCWQVLGQSTEVEENLRARRSWLRGEATGRWALLLEFAFGKQPFEQFLAFGDVWEGELAFYPSAYPLRAVPKRGLLRRDLRVRGLAAEPFGAVLDRYSQALAQNPWVTRVPVVFSATLEPLGEPSAWTLRCGGGEQVRLHPRFNLSEALLAQCGGYAPNLFGEWDGQTFLPLCAHSPEDLDLFNLTHQEQP
ncbi:MAG: SWIM zinc finger family protein [Meiothermus sp.]|nr:SWIM zinc finger family protein [Meiothermus sp.]